MGGAAYTKYKAKENNPREFFIKSTQTKIKTRNINNTGQPNQAKHMA